MRYAAAFFPVPAGRLLRKKASGRGASDGFEKKLREVAYFGLVDGKLRAQRVRCLLAGGNDSLALRYPV